MTISEFIEILDFAIAPEQEAVSFYRDLQSEAKFLSQKEFLTELEAMERGHIVVIENIRKTGVAPEDIQKTPNLKISEYLTVDADQLDLTYQNILIKAMKREEASLQLYSELSQKFANQEIAQLFRRLAADEAKHKLRFEQLYDEFISTGN
jgi:rubrerythrin